MSEAAVNTSRVSIDALLSTIRAEKALKVAAIGDVSQGAIIRQISSQRWAYLLPDMTEPGRWRIQYFDERGFSGHGIYSSPAELVDAAISGGFEVRDDGALDRVQNLPSFQRGCFVADLIGKVNSKAIDHRTADELLARYDAAEIGV